MVLGIVTVLPSLTWWWLRRFTPRVARSIRDWWREPEWPLLVVGCVLLTSFLAHWLGYVLAKHQVVAVLSPAEWEGRTGWRKPIVFAISNVMIFVSLRQTLRSQQLVSRSILSHVAAWATAVEVGIITLQAWRGVPSHFNVATSEDAVLYIVKLAGAVLLSVPCILSTTGCILKPLSIPPAKLAALRHGGAMLGVAILWGVVQVCYGHARRSSSKEEDDLCLKVTAGAQRSPCYEIYGANI